MREKMLKLGKYKIISIILILDIVLMSVLTFVSMYGRDNVYDINVEVSGKDINGSLKLYYLSEYNDVYSEEHVSAKGFSLDGNDTIAVELWAKTKRVVGGNIRLDVNATEPLTINKITISYKGFTIQEYTHEQLVERIQGSFNISYISQGDNLTVQPVDSTDNAGIYMGLDEIAFGKKIAVLNAIRNTFYIVVLEILLFLIWLVCKKYLYPWIRKEENKKILIIYMIMCVIVGLIMNTYNRYNLQMDIDAEGGAGGSVHLYYMGEEDAIFSESKSRIRVYDAEDSIVSIDLGKESQIKGYIRCDFTSNENIGIKSIKIKKGFFTLGQYTGEEILNIISSSHFDYSYEGDEILCELSKDGNNIMYFNVGELKLSLTYYVIYYSIILVLAGVLFFIYFFIRKNSAFFEGEKFKLYLKTAVTLIVAIATIYVDYKSISNINSNDTQSYEIQENKAYGEIAEDYRIEFTNYGKNLNSVELYANWNGKAEGWVRYSILDAEGSILITHTGVDINELLTDAGTLLINTDDIEVQRNSCYVLNIEFNTDSDIQIAYNPDGQVIVKQNYLFIYKNVLIAGIVGINILIGICMYLLLKKGLTDKLFLIVALASGIIMIFINPPASKDDEYRHFIRAYEISDGTIRHENVAELHDFCGNAAGLNEKGTYPLINVSKDVNDIRLLDVSYNYNDIKYQSEVNEKLSIDRLISLCQSNDSEKTMWVSEVATSVLTPLSYLPQIVFMFIGKIFGANAIILYYFARLGNVIAAVGLGYLSLRLAKDKKIFVWVLYFMPAMVSIRSSCSSDGWLYSVILFALCYIWYIKERKKYILDWKNIAVLVGCATLIIIMKIPYALVIYTLLFTECDNFKKITKKWKSALYAFLIATGILLAGYIINVGITSYNNSKLYVNASVDYDSDDEQDTILGVLKKDYVDYAMDNPKKVYELCNNELWTLTNMLEEFNGNLFGVPYILCAILILGFTEKKLPIWKMIGGVLLFYIIGMAVMFFGYQMSAIEAITIKGVGPRYILTIIPLLFICIQFGTKKTELYVNRIFPYIIMGYTLLSEIESIGYLFI